MGIHKACTEPSDKMKEFMDELGSLLKRYDAELEAQHALDGYSYIEISIDSYDEHMSLEEINLGTVAGPYGKIMRLCEREL